MPELSHSDSWVWSQPIAPFPCQIQVINAGIAWLGKVAAHKLLSTSVHPCTLNRVSKQCQSWAASLQGSLASGSDRGDLLWGVFTQLNKILCWLQALGETWGRGADPWLTGVIFSCFLPKPLFANSLRVGFCFDVLLSLKSLVLLLAPVIFGVLWREGGREKK